jgi:hypothetical protein
MDLNFFRKPSKTSWEWLTCPLRAGVIGTPVGWVEASSDGHETTGRTFYNGFKGLIQRVEPTLWTLACNGLPRRIMWQMLAMGQKRFN